MTATQKASDRVCNYCKGGTIRYLEQLGDERTQILLERQASLNGQRLIKALGGAW